VVKELTRQLTPPILWHILSELKHRSKRTTTQRFPGNPVQQDLDLYWNAEFAQVLDTWGIGNTWHEIVFLVANCSGDVLDIACGTGKTMEIVSQLANIEIYGCDISDFLIQKAVERGIPQSNLMVCDATQTHYQDNQFDYSYSIGSLEHFTDEGIDQFVRECYRITKHKTFHMVPTSKSGQNEGWTKTVQSFFNNSPEWWLGKFRAVYENVYTLDSLWKDDISVGKWLVADKKS